MSCVAAVEDREPAVHRLSVPRRGQVLSTVTERYGGPVRSAVQVLVTALSKRNVCAKGIGIASEKEFGVVQNRPAAEMIARHVCAQWIVGFALGRFDRATTLVAGLRWFSEENPLLSVISALDEITLSTAQESLSRDAEPAAFSDLLPYILDPHGPGSRTSMLRDPETGAARTARRANGVFYTPADVAEYMVQAALSGQTFLEQPRILDLACGTGVFLRAALHKMMALGFDGEHIASKCLFGVDIDPWAVDGATYVLLHDVLCSRISAVGEPSSLWRSIRKNLVIADALCLDSTDEMRHRSLFDLKGEQSRFSLKEVFPGMGGAPNVFLGNPPYAAIGARSDILELTRAFTTIPTKSLNVGDLHPLFFEQMVRLGDSSVSGALVIPLSIAFSSGQQFSAMRQLVEATAGTWKFSFFDREPHALFGEDVKTRNTIVTWHRKPEDKTSCKLTGPLIKWRGHDRARMLRGLSHTELSRPISRGIPKVSSKLQSDVLNTLTGRHATMSDLISAFRTTSLEQTFHANRKTVFVGGTAYNFLNVLFRPSLRYRRTSEAMSSNTMHALSFASVREATAAFALLTSGMCFWLWHIQGDGFHLSRSFLEHLPLSPSLFNAPVLEELSRSGLGLWRELQLHPVESLNRGKASLSFPASRLRRQQQKVDALIIDSLGLPAAFMDELDSFINSVISALPSTVAPTEALEEVLAI